MDSDYPRGTCENVVYHFNGTIQTIITSYLRPVSYYSLSFPKIIEGKISGWVKLSCCTATYIYLYIEGYVKSWQCMVTPLEDCLSNPLVSSILSITWEVSPTHPSPVNHLQVNLYQ